MLPTSAKKQSGIHPRVLKTPAEIWHGLMQQATHMTVAQIDAFLARLSNALLAASEQSTDSKEANLSFHAGQLLKENGYSFYYLASAAIEANFRKEIEALQIKTESLLNQQDVALTLVSYEEMDAKLALAKLSRTLELACAEELTALNMRLAKLMDCDSVGIAQNPFRPDIFLKTMQAVWREFIPDSAAHHLILSFLRTDILFELAPIYRALNETLVSQGILPDLQESYRVKKTASSVTAKAEIDAEPETETLNSHVAQKLRKYFSANQSLQGSTEQNHFGVPQFGGDVADQVSRAVDTKLFQYLADLQKNMAISQMATGTQDFMRLSQIREQMPELANNGVEKHTLDLLSKIFDTVFRNQDIPKQIKELISLLQVPVLKAALMDKEFFFQDTHPARRLIDLLSKHSVSIDQDKGHSDPLYLAMKENVSRVQREFDQQVDTFDSVVSDLEKYVAKEEAENEQALQLPITQALKKEKFKQANFAAKNEVALRVRTGEVLAFVETFLENRWIKVLTLAYSVKDDKPQAVADAIKTMDDLIWSVKPKINLEERQEMVSRLPAILVRLNKWLSLIKWDESDQLQFFSELAECHASIVRAPLDLTPERQLEIAVEVAQQAAERRLEKRAQEEAGQPADIAADDFTGIVASLERGVWLQFTRKDDSTHNVRLAWVSPMRSLYIFTSSQKEKSFSVSTEELEQSFREQRAQILVLDKVVDRALVAALDELPVQEEVASE
ncbi:DUF1631 family protein [Undibacterium sp. Ren11W]|uniref:DUF1631 family protein n=1 Tax=Undibacterium sp. Ren11W TaxID=3413045 RepID=UPI003BF1D589